MRGSGQVSLLRRHESELREQLTSTRQEALEYGTGLRDALRETDELRGKVEQVTSSISCMPRDDVEKLQVSMRVLETAHEKFDIELKTLEIRKSVGERCHNSSCAVSHGQMTDEIRRLREREMDLQRQAREGQQDDPRREGPSPSEEETLNRALAAEQQALLLQRVSHPLMCSKQQWGTS